MKLAAHTRVWAGTAASGSGTTCRETIDEGLDGGFEAAAERGDAVFHEVEAHGVGDAAVGVLGEADEFLRHFEDGANFLTVEFAVLKELEVDGASLLPADESGYGFDNIGDVLSVSPGLLERYMIAAQKISSVAVGDPAMRPVVTTYKISPALRQDRRMGGGLVEDAA